MILINQPPEKKNTNMCFKKNYNPEKIINLLIAFLVQGKESMRDFCKELDLSQQALSYHLRQMNTSFVEIANLFDRDPNRTLLLIQKLIQNYNDPKRKKHNGTKIIFDKCISLKEMFEDPQICKVENQDDDSDLLNTQDQEPTDLNTPQSDCSQTRLGGLANAKKPPVVNLTKMGGSKKSGTNTGALSINHEEILGKAPSHLKSLVSSLLDAYDEADAKTKVQLFGTLMKYLKEVDQVKTGEGLEGWRSLSYVRPKNLAPKQIEVMRLCDEKMCVFVEGARRTRKSTTITRWDFEHALNMAWDGKLRSKTIYMASTAKMAGQIMIDMRVSPYSADIHEFIAQETQERSVYKFGHIFQVSAPDTGSVKGGDTDVVIIDEADVVYAHNPKAIADLVVTALTNNLKIIFMANRPDGEEFTAFQQFTSIFTDIKYWTNTMNLPIEEAQKVLDQIAYVRMEQSDMPEMKGEEFNTKKNLLMGIQAQCVSKEYADSQLGDKTPISGVTFSAEHLRNAKYNYKEFMENDYRQCEKYERILAIDPSGGTHPTGVSVWEYCINAYSQKWHITCLFAKQFEGEINKNDNALYAEYLLIIGSYGVSDIICESNSGGNKLVHRLVSDGYPATSFNIRDGDRTMFGPDDFIKAFRSYLYEGAIHYESDQLHNQLGSYSPHTSKGTKTKGDIADSSLLATYWLHLKHRGDEDIIRSKNAENKIFSSNTEPKISNNINMNSGSNNWKDTFFTSL